MEPPLGTGLKEFVLHSSKWLVALVAVVLGTLAVYAISDSGSILKIISGSNEPVRVIGIQPIKPEQPYLLIEIENLTAKPIRFVSYTVAPADCPRSNHPVAFSVGYGDRSAAAPNFQKPIDLPIPGYGKKEIRFPKRLYDAFLQSQKSHGCSSQQLPELWLDKVAFCDETGWEGFADGPDHSEWNGRDWKPFGKSKCSGSK